MMLLLFVQLLPQKQLIFVLQLQNSLIQLLLPPFHHIFVCKSQIVGVRMRADF